MVGRQVESAPAYGKTLLFGTLRPMHTFIPHEPLVFVDLETTGANFANDRIIEIGLVEVDADGAREWSALVNPEQPISSFITGLTGIDDSMVESAPRFAELAPEVLERLRGRLFIAHNARFDYGFLKREFKRLEIDFRAPSVCTVKLSRRLFPQHHRHNLDSLVERHGIAVSGRHRALADARVLWELWQCWHGSLPEENLRSAVEHIAGRPELPPQIDPSLVDDLPEAPGASAFYDAEGALLLVERASNIRQQVLAQFAPARRDTALVRKTCRVEWRESAGELGARLHEIHLSQPMRKPADELCSWQLVQDGEGDFRPALIFARDLDFARADDLFGLYMNRREAAHALRKLAEAHKLCHGTLGLEDLKAGAPCPAFRQKRCKGVCAGKEAVSMHSARLITALAKFKLKPWPYPGPVAFVERDDFGTREDFHLIDGWRHLATVSDEAALHERLAECSEPPFDADIYRLLGKFLQAGKLRVVPLGTDSRNP